MAMTKTSRPWSNLGQVADGDLPMIWGVADLVNMTQKRWKDPPLFMGNSTIILTIFNSYARHNQRVYHNHRWGNLRWSSLVIVCYRSAAKKIICKLPMAAKLKHPLLQYHGYCHGSYHSIIFPFVGLNSVLLGKSVQKTRWGNLIQ